MNNCSAWSNRCFCCCHPSIHTDIGHHATLLHTTLRGAQQVVAKTLKNFQTCILSVIPSMEVLQDLDQSISRSAFLGHWLFQRHSVVETGWRRPGQVNSARRGEKLELFPNRGYLENWETGFSIICHLEPPPTTHVNDRSAR